MTSPRAVPETGVDPRAVHRALTGMRDRLRIQEDELERLVEMIRNGSNRTPQPAAVPPIENFRDEMAAYVDARLKEQIAAWKRPIQMPGPSADEIQERVEKNLLPQIHALQTQVGDQGKMLQEAFTVMGRTDTNLRRLITQVDRLLEEMARRPQPAPQHIDVTSEPADIPPPPRPMRPAPRERSAMFTAVEDLDEFEEQSAPRFRWLYPVVIMALLIGILGAVWYWYFRDSAPTQTIPTSIGAAVSPLDEALAYETERNYPRAEQAYRELLARDPTNDEVIRHLASVLYREDKLEESAEISKRLKPAPVDAAH